MQQANAGRQRDHVLDIIKAVAIVCVVAVHSAAGAFSFPIGSFDWMCGNFWSNFLRCGVPLFLMCSGVVFLNPERELTLKKLYGKYIPRILVALFFWAFLYKLFGLYASGSLNGPMIWQAVKELLCFNHQSHLYYLHIILLVYVMTPALRVFTRSASRSEQRYVLIVWFILGIVYPMVKTTWPFTLLTGIPSQWMINMAWSAIGYFLLGHYLRTWKPVSRGAAVVLFVLGFCVVFFGVWLTSVRDGSLNLTFAGGMSVGIAMKAIGIFSFVDSFKPRDGRAMRAVTWFSKASFCIYLVHIFFHLGFLSVGFDATCMPPLLSIPLMTVANILCCLVVYAVLSHIPVVKKWLV